MKLKTEIQVNMKIVQINAVYEFSSTGRITTEMHEYMQRKGIESYVFCVNCDIPEKKVFKVGTKFDYKIHSFLSHLLGRQGCFSYLSTYNLIRKLKRIKPDIVHLGVLHNNFINLPILLNYLAKEDVGVVLTLHDCWFFTGHCCYFTDTNCSSWISGCGNCPAQHTWNTSWFFDNSSKNLQMKKKLFGNIKRLAVVGVSDWVKDLVHDSILQDAKIITRIYNWIDVDKFQPRKSNLRQQYNLKEKDFVVICVAQNWCEQKGLFDILEIANRAKDKKFLMIGGMPPDICIPSNVITCGVLDNVDKLVEHYSIADVFFNPSIRETFGLVTVEAISCGTPVVGYNTTATPELIPEGCGYVVPIKDFDAVLERLNDVQRLTKKHFSPNCHKFAKNNFEKTALIEQYLNLYKLL